MSLQCIAFELHAAALQRDIGALFDLILNSAPRLAGQFKRQGQHDIALELYEHCRQMQESGPGRQRPEHAILLGDMASCLELQGQFKEAMKLHEQCMGIMGTTVGKQHPKYAISMSGMAGCLEKQGHSGEAIQIFE